MPLVKCIRRCWDSQATIRYYPGDTVDLPEDHPLVRAKCFEPVVAGVTPNTTIADLKEEIQKAVIADLQMKEDESVVGVEKPKKRGNPNWVKK